MNFVAIDFETASNDRASACAVGLIVVRDGQVVSEYETLIRPPSLDFSPRNIAIHGIRPEQVANKPTFGELWPQLSGRIRDDLLIAHNAPFDIAVLCACLATFQLPRKHIEYVCTLEMARQLLPGLPSYRLSTLASLFGINPKRRRHQPVIDAVVCARLAILLGRLADDGFQSFVRQVGEPSVNEISSSRGKFTPGAPSITVSEFGPDEADMEERSPHRFTQKIDLVGAAGPDGRCPPRS